MLPREALTGHAVREGLCTVSPRLTQVPHEEGHIGSGVGGTGAQGVRGQQGPSERAGRTPQVTPWLEPSSINCLPARPAGSGPEGRTGGGGPRREPPHDSPCPGSGLAEAAAQGFLHLSPAHPKARQQESTNTARWAGALSGARPLWGGQPRPGPPPQPLYLNSFSLFPRRSRTSQWELKASWGGMPQRMMAFRKAFRCRALKPSTWAGGEWGGGAENSGMGREADGGEKLGETQRRQDPETQGSVLAPPLLGCDAGQAPRPSPPPLSLLYTPRGAAGMSSLF